MMPQQNLQGILGLLRTACAQTTKFGFWVLSVASVLLGLALAAPFLYLITQDQVGVRAFLLNCIWELCFPLFAIFVAYVVARETVSAIHRGGTRHARLAALAKGILGCVLSLSLGLVVLSLFWANVRYHVDLQRLVDVKEIRTGCKTISGAQVAPLTALRQARWFAPISHGWTKDIPLVLELESGGERRWYIHRILYQHQAVILSSDANPGMVVSADFASLMQQRGLWQVHERSSESGSLHYYEISAETDCWSEHALNGGHAPAGIALVAGEASGLLEAWASGTRTSRLPAGYGPRSERRT